MAASLANKPRPIHACLCTQFHVQRFFKSQIQKAQTMNI